MLLDEYTEYSEAQMMLTPQESDYSELYHKYLRLNHTRFNRILNTVEILEPLKSVVQKFTMPMQWLIITEPWCGDAAQSVPVMLKTAALNALIKVELVLRDRNPDIMNQYLTEGSKSIPILVIRDASGNDLAVWGPRPVEAQALVNKLKKTPTLNKEDAMEQVQRWYIQDKSTAVQGELKLILHNLLRN